MMVQWLMPAAWWGLALLAVPVLIHLLARHRGRRVRFPSLTLVPGAQVAALRRRVIANWPLLLLRLLVIATAVAAAAAPVFVSDARRASWNERTARAIVMTTEQEMARSLAAAEARTSLTHAEFRAPAPADAVDEAIEWLRQQPPAARELIVVGPLPYGSLGERDVERIPSHVGIRFLPVADREGPRSADWRAVGDSTSGEPASYVLRVTPEIERTRAIYTPDGVANVAAIRLVASPEQQPVADALLRAVLRDGLVLGGEHDRGITVVFAGGGFADEARIKPPAAGWMRDALGGTPGARGGEVDGRLVVMLDMAPTDRRAPHAVSGLLRAAVADPHTPLEPRRIDASTLAAWSRPPGGSPPDVSPSDEGDRRWFWGAALLLLAVEQVLRRRRAG